MKEDGEYTCVPGNRGGSGSNASVSFTTVGECNVRSLVKINYYQVESNYCQYFFSAEVITLS